MPDWRRTRKAAPANDARLAQARLKLAATYRELARLLDQNATAEG